MINPFDPKKPHRGCFLCKEAKEAAESCGVLLKGFPVNFKRDEEGLYVCALTGSKENLFMCEIKNGTDENVMRNVVAKMFELAESCEQ